MNIMDLFRPAQPAATPANTPPAPGGPTQVANPGQPMLGTQATPQTASNGIVPAQPAATNTDPVSPLDTFKDIWQTPTNAAPEGNQPMFANVTPQSMMEAAGKVDFTKTISPEHLQAIAAGGEQAVKAFAESMNKVAQSVYAQSAFATTKIVDQALEKAQQGFDARLPSLVKKLSVNENLQDNNPLLNNPALTPLVQALGEQLVRKNPSATSSEIQSQVNDYFAALGSTFAPKAPETPASRAAAKAAKSEDWSAFLS